MHDADIRRLTGVCGVVIGVMATLTIPLYFIHAGPPPAWNVLTRDVLNLVLCGFLIVFITGLSHLIRKENTAYEWVASLIYGTGLLYVAVTLVATSLEAGVVFGTPDGTVDPTIDGPLAEGNILLHGSVRRLLTVIFLGATGYAVRHVRLLPGWAGWAAYGIALCNLAFVPSLYFGSDAAQFYSAVGWGNTALTSSLLLYWMLAVGIVMLRQARKAPEQTLMQS